jgi:hypothetical protein
MTAMKPMSALLRQFGAALLLAKITASFATFHCGSALLRRHKTMFTALAPYAALLISTGVAIFFIARGA